jgi:hypothetical protein
MGALELKVPPPIVALVLALLMWLTPAMADLVQLSYPARVLCAVVLVCIGQAIGVSVLWLVVYVLYITRFQIIPEERVLASLFGAGYEAYKGRVRRWI